MGKYSPPHTILDRAISGVTTVYSDPIDLLEYTKAGFEISWTGSWNATFQLQGSVGGVNYPDTGTAINPATGSTGYSLGNIGDIGFRWARIAIIPSSGSATNVTVQVCAKE